MFKELYVTFVPKGKPILSSECGDVEQNILLGAPLRLEVRVVGDPIPSITWEHNARQLRDGNNVHIQTENGRSALTIQKTTIKHGGKYIVRTENNLGKTFMEFLVHVSGGYSLQVIYYILLYTVHDKTCIYLIYLTFSEVKLLCKNISSNVTARVGSHFNLRFNYRGYPTPQITWRFNGAPLTDKAVTVKTSPTTNFKGFVEFAIAQINFAHSGYYQAVAEIPQGKDVMNFYLSVVGK